VVTGAQRPYNGLSSDAQMNLLDAIRLASAPVAGGMGALVAFNGEINAAREVTKTNTYHLQTFQTRDLGLLGYIDADKIEFYRTPHRRHTTRSEFSLAAVPSMPYVEIAYIHTGTRAGIAKAMVALGAKGIVIAGVGAGAPNSLDKGDRRDHQDAKCSRGAELARRLGAHRARQQLVRIGDDRR
jgi:L-asparaginase